jgi:hypothetical protein
MYLPIVHHRDKTNEYFEDAGKEIKECESQAEKRETESQNNCQEYLSKGGIPTDDCGPDPTKRPPTYKEDLELCRKISDISLQLPDAMRKQGVYGVYREYGFNNLAISCFGPPLCLAVLAVLVTWITNGFTPRKSPGAQK